MEVLVFLRKLKCDFNQGSFKVITSYVFKDVYYNITIKIIQCDGVKEKCSQYVNTNRAKSIKLKNKKKN